MKSNCTPEELMSAWWNGNINGLESELSILSGRVLLSSQAVFTGFLIHGKPFQITL